MKIIRYFLQLLCISLCITCAKEQEITPRTYSRVKTVSISNITTEGALFEGEIIFLGNEAITEHGFLWSRQNHLDIHISEIVNLGPVTSAGKFSMNVQRGLRADIVYYVCSYLKSGDRYIFGNILEFKSLGSLAP